MSHFTWLVWLRGPGLGERLCGRHFEYRQIVDSRRRKYCQFVPYSRLLSYFKTVFRYGRRLCTVGKCFMWHFGSQIVQFFSLAACLTLKTGRCSSLQDFLAIDTLSWKFCHRYYFEAFWMFFFSWLNGGNLKRDCKKSEKRKTWDVLCIWFRTATVRFTKHWNLSCQTDCEITTSSFFK